MTKASSFMFFFYDILYIIYMDKGSHCYAIIDTLIHTYPP